MSDRDALILDRHYEIIVWAHAYAAALTIAPALGELPIGDGETERDRADRCARIADLAVYRFRERQAG